MLEASIEVSLTCDGRAGGCRSSEGTGCVKIYEAYIRKCEWAQWEQPILYDMQVTQQGLPNQHEVIAIRIPGTWQDQ